MASELISSDYWKPYHKELVFGLLINFDLKDFMCILDHSKIYML